MKMTLRQLTLFECVARHMSFTRAAEEMHLTQPAVSIQLKQLEGHVGMALFEQIGKKLYLTSAGGQLQLTCRDVFSSLDNLEMALTQMKGLMHGTLRVAVVTSAMYFAPHLLGAFQREYPEIRMRLVVRNRNQVLQRLVNNEDDLVLMAQVPQNMKLVSYPFLDNPMIPVVPPGHPLVGKSNLSLSIFNDYRFLSREEGSGSRKAIEDHLRERDIELEDTMELGGSETIKQGLMAGLGISILSRHSVALELATGLLVELDVESFPIVRSWCIVHHREKSLSPVAEAFIKFMHTNGQTVREMLRDRFMSASIN
ncbi:MAG: LysR substrate-binding domain-containing protein [Motiliproteus sp.]